MLSIYRVVSHLHTTRLELEMLDEGICQPRGKIKGLAPHQTCHLKVFHYSRTFPPIVTVRLKDPTMHLISRMLIAISLSLLHLVLTNTSAGIYALPINEPVPKSDSRIHSPTGLSRLPSNSLRLIGRQIRNADYGSGEQPQNTTYGTSNSSSNASNASSPAPDSKAPPAAGKSPKTDMAQQNQSLRQLRTKEDIANNGTLTRRYYTDVSSHESSNDATPHSENPNNYRDLATSARLAPRRLARRTYKSLDYAPEDSDCGHYVLYPSMRMRYAHDPNYGVIPRSGRDIHTGAFSYPDEKNDYRSPRRLRTANGQLWDGENRDDVSGDRGFPETRHFDPRDFDRMLAAYDLSHGIHVD
ncbi:hypothetical protein F5887DRAFT_645828 [Amanita rubescens]|nr:hypothetical protein F5887DRAFT_645828 [Amanita rubescens]